MDILEKIKKLCEQRGWSLYKLADEAGITQSTLTNMFYRKTLPSITTLTAICNAFDITLSQFFDEHRNFADLSAEEEKFVNQYRLLNKENKKLISVILDEMTRGKF